LAGVSVRPDGSSTMGSSLPVFSSSTCGPGTFLGVGFESPSGFGLFFFS